MVKRTFLIIATLIFFSANAWSQLMDSPWPKIHHDIKNTGFTNNVGTAIGNLKWFFQTEKPITSSPALDNNNRIYFGSADKNIYCLDRTTGGLIWKYQTGDAIEHSSPAIDINGILYIGSVDGKFYAFDTININTSNPQPLWAFTTGAGIYGSPTIAADGTVYFGSADGYLYQINPSAQEQWPADNLNTDGTKYVWKTYIGIIWSTPTIDNVIDIDTSTKPGLIIGSTKYFDEYGTSEDTGGICGYKFSTTLKAYNVFVYNLNTKAIIWYGPKIGPTISGMYGSIVLQPDRTVLIPTESDGLLSGPLCWLPVLSGGGCIAVPADADKWCLSNIVSGFITGTPAMEPHGAYFLGHDNTFTRFRPSGSEYLSFPTEGNIESSPAVDGNLNAYVGCDGGVFYCLNSDSPEQPLVWRYPTTGFLQKLNGDAAEIISSPAIDNDAKHSMYFGASDGKMYAFFDGAAILGTITTDGTTPLPAVTVSLKDSTDTVVAVTSTDTAGFFKFSAPPAGQYTVIPSKDGYIFNPISAPVTLTSADAVVNFTASLAFAIIGKVVNTADSTGLDGVAIALTTTDAAGTVVYQTTGITQGGGNYSFGNIGYGLTTITPSKPGYGFSPSAPTQNIPTGTTGGTVFPIQTIEATLGYQVSGKVTDATVTSADNGLAGVTVTLTGTPTGGSAISIPITTDSQGSFSFTGLQSGTYTVTPTLASYKFEPPALPAVIEDASITGLVFQGAQGIKISGVITLATSGATFDGFTVNLYQDDQTFWGKLFNKEPTLVTTAPVSATGSFIFLGIAAGKYIVKPVATGYGFDPAERSITALSDVTDLLFTASSGLTITGRISSIIGIPQSGIVVSLTDGVNIQTATTGVDGSYTFTGLNAGTFIISPESSGFYVSIPLSKSVTLSTASVRKVNFAVFSFCTKTYIIIPPWGTTGATVNIIGTMFGPTPDPASSSSVDVTLWDGSTGNVPAGVYFGISTDTSTWTQATVTTWSPFYITAQVPLLDARLLHVFVVRPGTTACINNSLTNFFINTRP